MVFVGHGLSDPEYPILKLVGVYPVMDGWGFIDLDQVTGKGQDYRSPLYVVLGKAHKISPKACLLRQCSVIECHACILKLYGLCLMSGDHGFIQLQLE